MPTSGACLPGFHLCGTSGLPLPTVTRQPPKYFSTLFYTRGLPKVRRSRAKATERGMKLELFPLLLISYHE